LRNKKVAAVAKECHKSSPAEGGKRGTDCDTPNGGKVGQVSSIVGVCVKKVKKRNGKKRGTGTKDQNFG